MTRVLYPKCAYGPYYKFNLIENGVYILLEVSLWIWICLMKSNVSLVIQGSLWVQYESMVSVLVGSKVSASLNSISQKQTLKSSSLAFAMVPVVHRWQLTARDYSQIRGLACGTQSTKVKISVCTTRTWDNRRHPLGRKTLIKHLLHIGNDRNFVLPREETVGQVWSW